jgi:hypothetical protein
MGPPLSEAGDVAPGRTATNEILFGRCICGHATYTLDAHPAQAYLTLSAYCHCSRCQRTHAAPFTHTTHWKRDAVTWTSPAGHIAAFEQVEGVKWKLRCAGQCGVQLGSWNERKQECVPGGRL